MIPALLTQPRPELADALQGRADRIALAVPGLASSPGPCLDQPVAALHENEPWLFLPAALEPQRGPGKRHVLPLEARIRLQLFTESGVDFDDVYIGHQLPPEANTLKLRDALRRRPITCTVEAAEFLLGPLPPHRSTLRLAHGLAAVGGIIQGGLRGVVGVLPAIADALDPVVFGISVVQPGARPGEPVLWTPCAAWAW